MIDSIITLIPEELREQPFYIKIVEIVNNILTEREEDFNDIYNKFRDFDKLHQEALESLIQEFGYEYVTDILEFSVTQVRTLSAFLFLIHTLKGHKEGLELVLRLIPITEYVLTEWWEKDPTGTVDTFDFTGYLDIIDFTYEEATAIINTRLKTFVRAYVYPLYELWDVRATIRVDGEVPINASFFTIGADITINPM